MSKWTPQNDEPALTLAAIRWYAMSLEKLAADLYITNREMYPEVRDILAQAFQRLGELRGYCTADAKKAAAARPSAASKKPRYPAGRWADKLAQQVMTAESSAAGGSLPKPLNFAGEFEDGCGPGYVNCDGVCLPQCDDIAEY
jgi:hypothetical protein